MKTGKVIAVSLLVGVVLLAGCKKVELNIRNHSNMTRQLQLTTPDQGTMSIGAVSAGGGTTTFKMTVKNEDLPAQCNLSAGPGSSQSFTVTEDTKDKVWFHIGGDGRITGPLDKDDTHVETEDRGEIDVTVSEEMIITP